MKTKTCTKCGETKPVSEFYKHKRAKDGLASHCKVCHNASVKAYRQTDKGKSVRTKAQAKYIKTEKGKANTKRWSAKYHQTKKGKAACARAKEKYQTKIPSSVYKITCLRNDCSYIGSSIKPIKRREKHWYLLKSNKHENSRLQADYDQYGKDAFIFEIIEDCSHLSEQELRVREQEYINAGTNLYNEINAVEETK